MQYLIWEACNQVAALQSAQRVMQQRSQQLLQLKDCKDQVLEDCAAYAKSQFAISTTTFRSSIACEEVAEHTPGMWAAG